MAALVAAIRIGDDHPLAFELKHYEKTPEKFMGADAEDEWLSIPKFNDKLTDESSPPPELWGHETQRAGHPDWLDGSVKAIKASRDLAEKWKIEHWGKKPKDLRKAIYDS